MASGSGISISILTAAVAVLNFRLNLFPLPLFLFFLIVNITVEWGMGSSVVSGSAGYSRSFSCSLFLMLIPSKVPAATVGSCHRLQLLFSFGQPSHAAVGSTKAITAIAVQFPLHSPLRELLWLIHVFP